VKFPYAVPVQPKPVYAMTWSYKISTVATISLISFMEILTSAFWVAVGMSIDEQCTKWCCLIIATLLVESWCTSESNRGNLLSLRAIVVKTQREDLRVWILSGLETWSSYNG
jgi:hypothetical protein